MTIHIRSLGSEDLGRISEIDRSEEIETEYVQNGERLVAQPATMASIPDFHSSGESHSVSELIEAWRPTLLAGGTLIGAFEGSTLGGIALLGAELAPGVLQSALLYVSRPFLRCGVASALVDELETVLARPELELSTSRRCRPIQRWGSISLGNPPRQFRCWDRSKRSLTTSTC